MASMSPRLPTSMATTCRAAMRVQHLHRASPTPAAYRTLTTTSTTTRPKHPRSRSSPHTPSTSPSPRPSAPLRRPYHSYDHPSPATPFSPTERAILTAAYAHVPAHGFSHAALALGARDAGYLDISTNLLPDGAFSLVQWHMVAQREALAARAQELFTSSGGEERMRVGRKVEALVWERLMGNARVIERWQEVRASPRTPRSPRMNIQV